MSKDPRQRTSRIVVSTGNHRQAKRRGSQRTYNELWVASSVIIAAGLATFLALFITSRPFDPISVSVAPEQVVPAGPTLSPSPKSSPTVSPTPSAKATPESTPVNGAGETTPATLDDATIQANIEKALNADPQLTSVDVSTLVENGKVTVVGSVKSTEIKQHVERVIQSLKGVTHVDNQLVVTQATP